MSKRVEVYGPYQSATWALLSPHQSATWSVLGLLLLWSWDVGERVELGGLRLADAMKIEKGRRKGTLLYVTALFYDYLRRLNWQVKWRMSSASQVISRPRLMLSRRS